MYRLMQLFNDHFKNYSELNLASYNPLNKVLNILTSFPKQM